MATSAAVLRWLVAREDRRVDAAIRSIDGWGHLALAPIGEGGATVWLVSGTMSTLWSA